MQRYCPLSPIPFLTIFTAPKPFKDAHIATIQRNAIQSWRHLGPEVEVLLVGDEEGMAEVAAEYGLRQLGEVRRSEGGTPLVSSIFALARQESQALLLAYINADILLLPDFVEAARQVKRQVERFLVIGQRWDLDVRTLLDYSPGWDERLREDVQRRGRLHMPAGSDYFIFPQDLFAEIPDFTIGRAGWDNWMIFQARQQGWPVIDATPSIMAIHQDHDYRHLPGGRPHYEHPESQVNQALAGGSANLYMVLDSDRQLVHGRVRRPRLTLLRALRQAEMWLTPPGSQRRGLRWKMARPFRRLRRRITGSLE
jgi:hypothetical protein